MSEPKVLFQSSASNTDFLHTLAVAAPLFLILVGSYVLYQHLIGSLVIRLEILLIILVIVAWVAPFGSRLKHMQVSEEGCVVFPSHTDPYTIEFREIEVISINHSLGVVKLKLCASSHLPGNAVWFIPEPQEGASKDELLENVRSFFFQRVGLTAE
jgi:hypothetical protein